MIEIEFLKDFAATRLLRWEEDGEGEPEALIQTVPFKVKFRLGERVTVRPAAQTNTFVTSGNILLDGAVEGVDFKCVAGSRR